MIWVSLSFLTFVHSRQCQLGTTVKNGNGTQIKVNYLFKISNGNVKAMCKISTKLTTKTPEPRYWHRSNVFYCYDNVVKFVSFFQIKIASEDKSVHLSNSRDWTILKIFVKFVVIIIFCKLVTIIGRLCLFEK